MKLINRASLFAMAFLLTSPGHTVGSDLDLSYSLVTATTEEGVVRGRLRIELFNPTDADIKAVDIRLNESTANTIEKGVWQLGTIPAGEVRAFVGNVLLEERLLVSGYRISWRIDYEDLNRNHKRSTLAGTRKDSEVSQ